MKTVLIISYYWPPSGGGGVQRWLKFSKYLPENGWHCIICTPDNPSFDIKDASLESEIHPDTEVLKIPIWEPYTLFKKLKKQDSFDQGVTPSAAGALSRFIRGNFFIPDPRRFWITPAVRFLSQFLKGRQVDAIITTGPPHSMHLIGHKLYKKFGLPWFADFRDPWSRWDMLNEFNLTGFAKERHRQLEHKVVTQATGVITVSQEWADDFHRDHGVTPKVITNGFDESDFRENTIEPDEFIISHAGLLNEFRNAPQLWECISDFFMEEEIDGEVVLKGMVDQRIKTSIQKLPFKARVSIGPSVSHEEVLTLYRNSAILLLFMNQTENAPGHIPGKLFEYIAANRWILAIGDPEGASARIIRETGHGVVVSWGDSRGMRQALSELHDKFRMHQYPPDSGVSKYSRKNLTAQLAKYLNSGAQVD